MRILLTGATGYIGGAVLRRLRADGHDVVAYVRSAAAAARVAAGGAVPVVGDLRDVEALRARLEGVDAAVHAATAPDAATLDDAVIAAVEGAFVDGRPYVHTGGVWAWGAGQVQEDAEPTRPPQIVAWRPARERRVLALSGASVIAPGIVYGNDGGIPAAVIAGAPRDAENRLRTVGAGSQRWMTVHVDDLADLYLRVLQGGERGVRYVGASGVAVVGDLSRAAGDDGVVTESDDEARARLGTGFADALLLDQWGEGTRATALGWRPERPSLVAELADRVTPATTIPVRSP